jgi:hypothetical protein
MGLPNSIPDIGLRIQRLLRIPLDKGVETFGWVKTQIHQLTPTNLIGQKLDAKVLRPKSAKNAIRKVETNQFLGPAPTKLSLASVKANEESTDVTHIGHRY